MEYNFYVGQRVYIPEHLDGKSDFAGLEGTILGLKGEDHFPLTSFDVCVGFTPAQKAEEDLTYRLWDCNGLSPQNLGYCGYFREIIPIDEEVPTDISISLEEVLLV